MTDTATPTQEKPVVVEIDRLMQILPTSLIGEYLKFDDVCDMLLDLRQLADREECQ